MTRYIRQTYILERVENNNILIKVPDKPSYDFIEIKNIQTLQNNVKNLKPEYVDSIYVDIECSVSFIGGKKYRYIQDSVKLLYPCAACRGRVPPDELDFYTGYNGVDQIYEISCYKYCPKCRKNSEKRQKSRMP